MALTNAERQKSYRERRKAGEKLVQYRRPVDRRSRPQRWAEAVETLMDILQDYQNWRESMPDGLADTPTAALLDEVLALHDEVEKLQEIELPRGFGRD